MNSSMSRYSASWFSGWRNPWPSPSNRCNSTSPPVARMASTKAIVPSTGTTGSAVPCSTSSGSTIRPTSDPADRAAYSSASLERTNQPLGRMSLEPVTARREVGEVGHGVQGDPAGDPTGMPPEHAEHGEAAQTSRP